MPFEGRQLKPREIADLCYRQGWRGDDLIKIVAVALSESKGYVGAYNENLSEDGTVLSKDCGVFQISVRGIALGGAEETRLLTDPEYNVERAWRLFTTPWGSPSGTRRFQPWVAYTSGWSTFPEWWVFSQSKQAWVPTGRYLQGALKGVANFNRERFGVREGYISFAMIPEKPRVPPADGIGKRPIPNSGDV